MPDLALDDIRGGPVEPTPAGWKPFGPYPDRARDGLPVLIAANDFADSISEPIDTAIAGQRRLVLYSRLVRRLNSRRGNVARRSTELGASGRRARRLRERTPLTPRQSCLLARAGFPAPLATSRRVPSPALQLDRDRFDVPAGESWFHRLSKAWFTLSRLLDAVRSPWCFRNSAHSGDIRGGSSINATLIKNLWST